MKPTEKNDELENETTRRSKIPSEIPLSSPFPKNPLNKTDNLDIVNSYSLDLGTVDFKETLNESNQICETGECMTVLYKQFISLIEDDLMMLDDNGDPIKNDRYTATDLILNPQEEAYLQILTKSAGN